MSNRDGRGDQTNLVPDGGRAEFADWIRDQDGVHLEDFTRDGYQWMLVRVDAGELRGELERQARKHEMETQTGPAADRVVIEASEGGLGKGPVGGNRL